jgi:thiamine biosynthesis protein ThiS
MVSITVNGKKQSFVEGPTIAELLECLEAPSEAVAVEVNRLIVPRKSHREQRLCDGDAVEVVTFVGGG